MGEGKGETSSMHPLPTSRSIQEMKFITNRKAHHSRKLWNKERASIHMLLLLPASREVRRAGLAPRAPPVCRSPARPGAAARPPPPPLLPSRPGTRRGRAWRGAALAARRAALHTCLPGAAPQRCGQSGPAGLQPRCAVSSGGRRQVGRWTEPHTRA